MKPWPLPPAWQAKALGYAAQKKAAVDAAVAAMSQQAAYAAEEAEQLAHAAEEAVRAQEAAVKEAVAATRAECARDLELAVKAAEDAAALQLRDKIAEISGPQAPGTLGAPTDEVEAAVSRAVEETRAECAQELETAVGAAELAAAHRLQRTIETMTAELESARSEARQAWMNYRKDISLKATGSGGVDSGDEGGAGEATSGSGGNGVPDGSTKDVGDVAGTKLAHGLLAGACPCACATVRLVHVRPCAQQHTMSVTLHACARAHLQESRLTRGMLLSGTIAELEEEVEALRCEAAEAAAAEQAVLRAYEKLLDDDSARPIWPNSQGKIRPLLSTRSQQVQLRRSYSEESAAVAPLPAIHSWSNTSQGSSIHKHPPFKQPRPFHISPSNPLDPAKLGVGAAPPPPLRQDASQHAGPKHAACGPPPAVKSFDVQAARRQTTANAPPARPAYAQPPTGVKSDLFAGGRAPLPAVKSVPTLSKQQAGPTHSRADQGGAVRSATLPRRGGGGQESGYTRGGRSTREVIFEQTRVLSEGVASCLRGTG